jgi:exopolysaccharide production protein ExoZ
MRKPGGDYMISTKINSLQVYRGVAALLVMLYHITDQSPSKIGQDFLGNIFSFGFVGVDFFFVLSGFIILYVHHQDIGRREELKGYLTKRFIRLYPIYWIIASIKLFSIYLIPSTAKSYETGFWYTIKSYLLIPQTNLPIIGAAWSLSYEVLCYLLFGIAILVGFWWAHRLLILWGALIISGWFLKFLNIPVFENNFFINFITDERNLEFILGCLAAYLILYKEIKYSRILIAAGILLFAIWGFYINRGNQVFSFTLTIGIAAFLLIIGSASFEIKKSIKWPKFLVFLGDASYSIYLTHVMFINILIIIFSRGLLFSVLGPLLSTFLILIFAVMGGCLVYVFLEKPVITRLRTRLLAPSPSKISVVKEMQQKTT